jgi:hypothetical protein
VDEMLALSTVKGTPSAKTVNELAAGMVLERVSLRVRVTVRPFAATLAELTVGAVVSTTVELLVAVLPEVDESVVAF